MEFVFVVPRSELFPDCYPHGLIPFDPSPGAAGEREESWTSDSFAERVSASGFFLERPYAERTPSFKQVIPYTIVVKDGQVLLLRRLAAGGEKRLHDKLSIGVGGHVNPVDVQDTEDARAAVLAAATERELREELCLDGTFTLHSVGLLNDDSTPVGAVHVGLVQILTTEAPVSIREQDVLEGRFVSPTELRTLRADNANFETWSALLVDHLTELLDQLPSRPLART